MNRKFLATALAVLGLGGVALAQSVSIPQVVSISPTDLFQDIPNGQPSSQSYYAPATLLANYGASQAGNNPENVLIGGDATTNLWQRATTGSSVTTTVTYGGPDRWAYWSGASTAMTVSRDSTAGDLSTAYQYAFKMARTSGQTGVVQTCMAQEVEGANSYAFQGATAELDFHAVFGSNFSGTGLTAYIVYGTGSDEGMQKLAWGLNAGGGGSTAWTGQANAVAGVITAAASSAGRYTVAGVVPATATEIGVAICFTPVGTAGTNDYVALSGIQLTRNSALTTVAGASGVVLPVNDTRAKAFSRRSQAQETLLQQRYYYQITESAAIYVVAPCAAVDTTHTNCIVQLPATMRIAPTMTYANGFASPTSTTQATLGACNTLASAATVTSTVASLNQVLVNCTATTIPAAGIASFLYSNNGSGTIKASAEF